MIDNLDMFQNMVDNGSISPSSLNMNSEQQLNNFNLWLAQLTESIEQEGEGGGGNTGEMGIPHQQQQQQEQQQQQQQEITNYADMLLQFNSNTLPIQDDNLYPTSAPQNIVEEDLYVRSHPMSQQPQLQSMDYNNPSKLYGDCTMNSYNYTNMAPITMDMPHMNGLRHHYTNVPGIVSNNSAFFTPDLRTSQNLHSSKDSVKYKPKNGQEKEERAAEAFKPIEPLPIETKKNVTTMMNVFTSVDGDNANKKQQSSSRSASSADETAKQSLAKKSSVNKDVLELLVSDMSDLTIQKVEEKAEEDISLYPTTVTADATSANEKLSKIEKHQKLLKQLSKWVNKNRAENPPQSTNTAISSRKQPSSVQVQ